MLTRRPTVVEGLYSGLGSGAALSSTQLDVKMKLLVEAPAAVEDALASLLDHHDAMLQVSDEVSPWGSTRSAHQTMKARSRWGRCACVPAAPAHSTTHVSK